MICTFTAVLTMIGSLFIQLFMGSSATTLTLAAAYHGLIVAAGLYVDRLISAGYKLGIPRDTR